MNVHDLFQELAMGGAYDDVLITDGETNYYIDDVHVDNGFVEITIKNDLQAKETAIKPDIVGDGCDENGNIIYDTWICPRCGELYEIDYDHFAYCPNCGQCLDWSEVV